MYMYLCKPYAWLYNKVQKLKLAGQYIHILRVVRFHRVWVYKSVFRTELENDADNRYDNSCCRFTI